MNPLILLGGEFSVLLSFHLLFFLYSAPFLFIGFDTEPFISSPTFQNILKMTKRIMIVTTIQIGFFTGSQMKLRMSIMTVRKYVCVSKEYKYKYFFSKNSGSKKEKKSAQK